MLPGRASEKGDISVRSRREEPVLKLTARRNWMGIGLVVVVGTMLIVANVVMATSTVAGMRVGPQRCIDSDNSDPDAHEECARLATFARQLLDQASHAPVASVTLYREPPSTILNIYGGYADFAIVSFRLSDETNQAFYVRCGVGIAKELCFDLRPLKPGDTRDQELLEPNPVAVP